MNARMLELGRRCAISNRFVAYFRSKMNSGKVIELINVCIGQSSGVIFDNLSMTVSNGEFIYLLGKTGSGKSSIIKCLYAEIPLQSGTGRVAGFDLVKLKLSQLPFLRRKLGIVFQDFQLLNDRSIFQNLRFVMKATGWKDEAVIKSKINTIFERVGLDGKSDKMPFNLSGGEQQRVTIARALVNQPEIILADEPTGNLDPETSAGIMRLLREISSAGTAVLFATHDMLMYNNFPARTLICEDGKLIEKG